MKHPRAYISHFRLVLLAGGPWALASVIVQRLISKSLRTALGEARGTRFFWILTRQGRVGGYGYEPNIARLVFQIHGGLAVDVGASLGQYTIYLARNFDRVLAIEPLPINIQVLSAIIRELHLTNVSIMRLAVSDHDGIAYLHINPKNIHGGSSIIGAQKENSLRVVTAKLDTLLNSETEINLVKVDVESAEWLVLGGASQVMPKIKHWMIELHNPKRKREMDRYLHILGYKTQWIEDTGPSLHVLATRS